MPLELSWREMTIRLALSVLAGAVIDANRERRRRPAGLRTATLVSLAAAAAMIEANPLLPQTGKARDSFVALDLMRLPLGVLPGIGFIGAGTIPKKGDTVSGVTTAATIWFVTVIGLCSGGGQRSLGAAAVGLPPGCSGGSNGLNRISVRIAAPFLGLSLKWAASPARTSACACL
jgi:putative Mg2+ transporter-C (MgtC) family protein